MNQNAASAQGGSSHEQEWWSARDPDPSFTASNWWAPRAMQRNKHDITKGRLILNDDDWAWMYPERSLWRPYHKRQTTSLQVKQNQAQQWSKLSRSPELEEHTSALLEIISLSWKRRHISCEQGSWRQLATSSSWFILVMETGGFSHRSHKEQVGSVHALTFGWVKERCMLSCAGRGLTAAGNITGSKFY